MAEGSDTHDHHVDVVMDFRRRSSGDEGLALACPGLWFIGPVSSVEPRIDSSPASFCCHLSCPSRLADRNAYADDDFSSLSFSCHLTPIAQRLPVMKTQPATYGWATHLIRVREGKRKQRRSRQGNGSACDYLPVVSLHYPGLYNRQAFRATVREGLGI